MKEEFNRTFFIEVLSGVLISCGLYLTILYNYLLFHSFAEIFSILIAVAIFLFAWNVRKFVGNNYFIFLGIAYLYVGLIDVVHTLSYKGMNIFLGYNANLPTQLWIGARYLESLSLVIAPLFITRKINMPAIFAVYTAAIMLLLTAVFYWDIFPDAFVEGVGLTPFKIASEYIISCMLIGAIIVLHRKHSLVDRTVYVLMTSSIAITILSEMAFTLYTDVYGFMNLLGHLFKIVSFYLIYKAIISTGLQRPYETMFDELKKSEAALSEANIALEKRVSERTAELTQANATLNEEMAERKETEEALRLSEGKYRLLVEQSPDIIHLIGPDGRFLSVNEIEVSTLGYTREEFSRLNYHDIISPAFRERTKNAFNIVKKEGSIIYENELITKDGEKIAVEVKAIAVRDDEGKMISTLGIVRDIRQRKKMEDELNRNRLDLEKLVEERTKNLEGKTQDLEKSRKALQYLLEDVNESKKELEIANEKLKELDRLKSSFLANMSHELRTPLNSIIGFTGIMLQGMAGELNEEQKKQLDMVYDSGKHLLGLINDILDLSKIAAGRVEIIPSKFKMAELLDTVKKMVLPSIEGKGLSLDVEISEDVPAIINQDKSRIKQVLINLLSNATKFTESGEIRVKARLIPGSGKTEPSAIEFSVVDKGIGIKPEYLREIFDEFKQIEGPLKEKPVGTGLGLAISKKIVEMMGGRIRAESEYGKGSALYFTVPIEGSRVAERPSPVKPETLDLSKKLILTIDDEIEAQEILKAFLKSEDYEVIQAYNALEAVELARKYRPFAITLDIIMPGRDGWDILHELKKDPQTEGIPVICISIIDHREMGLSLGAIEYFVKPIEKEEFIAELKRLESYFPICDILIIDDDPMDVELLARTIDEANQYTVRKAYGGKEGLDQVKERRPDLIILDLMMPGVDGFEVIQHLKKSEETKDVPILIVSAKKLTQDEIEYLNHHIERIIRKGEFTQEGLLRDIKKGLEKIGR